MIKFYIRGEPPTAWGKNSKKISRAGNKVFLRKPKQIVATDGLLVSAFNAYQGKPLDCAVYVVIKVVFPFRKSEPKYIREAGKDLPKLTAPDVDNISSSVYDALQKAGVIELDSQIVVGKTSKWWGSEPGIWVEVTTL